MKTIKANQKISTTILILTWSLMVFLPFFCFKIAISIFLETEFKQNRTKIEPSLYSELQGFCLDLDEKVMLEKKLMDFEKQNNYQTLNEILTPDFKPKIFCKSAKKIRKDIENNLKIPVLAILNYSTDVAKVDFDFNKFVKTSLRPPPKTMMKRMFFLLTKQYSCSPVFPNVYKPAFPLKTNFSASDIQSNYSTGVLQTIFGTAFPHKLIPYKITEGVASKAGKTGNLLFFFSERKLKRNGKTYNLGGYIAVIRLQDIPEKIITKFAEKRQILPDLKRKVVFLKKTVKIPDDYTENGTGQFYQFKNRYSLISTLPQVAISRRVQKGTIYPQDFSDYTGKMAAVETSILNSDLHHPMQKYFPELIFIANMSMLLGTTLFVRLWLYGLSFHASISLKIFISVFAICLIPISSLYILNMVYLEQDENATNENVKAFLESRASYVQRKISTEMSNYRHRTVQLGNLILQNGLFDDQSIKKILEKWCPENCANGCIFQNLDQRFFNYVLPSLLSDKEFMQSWELKKVFFNSVVEFILSSKLLYQIGANTSLLTDGSNNAESVHQMLANGENLITVARMSRNSRLSGFLLTEATGASVSPKAFLAVDYSVDKILKAIYQSAFKDFKFEENLSGYQIDLGIFNTQNNLLNPISSCSSKNLRSKEVLDLIGKRSKMKKKLFWTDKTSSQTSSSLLIFSPQFPFVIYAQSQKKASSNHQLSNILVWFYPLLVLATTILLSNLFFVSPARSLAHSLSEIAGGNLNHKLSLQTKDEFEVLSNEFNLMTKSLLEKEKLEKFVSPDLLEEINKSTESEMSPGGEKIQATVLFSSISGASSKTGADAAEKAVAQLDFFLGICNAICTQNHGVIDKLIGNTIMMVFRGTFTDLDHSIRACNAALQIKEATIGNSSLSCFSGISTGAVVSGKIGSKTGKLDYTVIGDTVNMAARLKSFAEKGFNPSIIISQNVYTKIYSRFTTKELASVKIKGKAGDFKIFEIV